jgi:phosphonate transport system permease protein
MNLRTKAPQEVKNSLVSPLVALISSLVVPGLGHALARAARKGLVLLLSMVSTTGLLVWRIKLTGRRETGWWAMTTKSFELEPVLALITIAVIVAYIWIAIDAYQTVKHSGKLSSFGLWIVILLAFFGLGWQIGEINLYTLATESQKAAPIMGRIAWPWDRAIYREELLDVGTAEIMTPCDSNPPAPSQEVDGQPLLVATPTCGDLSKQDGTPGTTISLHGKNFAPNTEVEIWWQDDMGNEFRQRQGGEYIKTVTDANGEFSLDVVLPYRVIPESNVTAYATWELQARQIVGLGDPQPSTELLLAIEKMIETIFLGMMATFFGIILAVPISFLAARNLMSSSWITMTIYYLVRTILNIIRSIEPLIWAVIAIIVVGLGPFAGIVALTLHSIAALGKLYSEAIESIDSGPIEAIQATGANWLQTVRYAVVPQVVPPFVSFTIYRWDINVRMSTVIGLVGGGGIGFVLIQWIHLLDYKAAGIAVWFISITVAILDYVSSEIRERFV